MFTWRALFASFLNFVLASFWFMEFACCLSLQTSAWHYLSLSLHTHMQSLIQLILISSQYVLQMQKKEMRVFFLLKINNRCHHISCILLSADLVNVTFSLDLCHLLSDVPLSIWGWGNQLHFDVSILILKLSSVFSLPTLSFIHPSLLTSLVSPLHHAFPLTSRPPDRRRRDLFGIANSTHPRHNRLHTNSSTVPPVQATGNSSTVDLEPADREYEFVEQAVTERELQISGLQPFTVYRIDIHACNRQVQRCSAAEFVFSRTKPAG